MLLVGQWVGEGGIRDDRHWRFMIILSFEKRIGKILMFVDKNNQDLIEK
jgi:hypothetical protein